jgi:predicted DNA-binding transcriptional regulator YafY
MAKADRLLLLLEALQSQPSHTGPELARRLGVDVRTVRRDVVALHALGIPVEAERGPGGGYRLGRGYRMPPLMLTAAEAGTVALALTAARHQGLDVDDALAKILRVLPDAVGARVEALEATLSFVAAPPAASPPEAEALLVLGEAARRGRRVRGRYTTAAGEDAARELSPHGVVGHGGRWYVPAFDHDRGELRTFRADRFRALRLGARGEPAPAGFDAAAHVTRSLARVPWAHEVEVLLRMPPEEAARRFPPTLAELQPAGGDTLLRMRADSLDWVAGLLAGAGCDFEIRRPAALGAAVDALGRRLREAGGYRTLDESAGR